MHVTIGTQGPQGAGTKMTNRQRYRRTPRAPERNQKQNQKQNPTATRLKPNLNRTKPGHNLTEFPLSQTKPGPAFESRIDTRRVLRVRSRLSRISYMYRLRFWG